MSIQNTVILTATLKNDKNLKVYYAILSSQDSKSLLIKQIVNKELALPYPNDININIEPSPQVLNEIRQQLEQFQFNDYFNPLFAQSNLYEGAIELLMVSDNGDKLM
mgnify:FL=1